jgi:hypothetical protein
MNARRFAPSRSEIIPEGSSSGIGIASSSPERLLARMRPIAPAAFAWAAFVTNGQRPRVASAMVPSRERFGSVPCGEARLPAGPQRCRSTGLPSVPVIVPTSTRTCALVLHEAGVSPPGEGSKAMPWRSAGAPAAVTSSEGAKTCVFVVAATVIAPGAVPGEPTEPSPNSSRSLPAAITGTTPASATFWTVLIRASLAGSVSGPPPEKLITSIPSRTAASKAETISGVSASSPKGVGIVKTR